MAKIPIKSEKPKSFSVIFPNLEKFNRIVVMVKASYHITKDCQNGKTDWAIQRRRQRRKDLQKKHPKIFATIGT